MADIVASTNGATLGWKTLAGAGVVAAGAILRFYGLGEVADLVMALGASLGLLGIRSAIKKVETIVNGG